VTVRTLLRLPGFIRLEVATFINGLGGWMLTIALPLYVLRATGSPLKTAGALAIEIVVDLVVGQMSGVLVDRWNRRITFAIVSVLEAAVLLPLLLVHGPHPRIWIIYPVAAAGSLLSTLSGPSAGALFPAVVPPELRVQGNSFGGLLTDTAQLVGGAAGGLVLGTAGLSWVVLVDAVTFLFAAALLAWPLGVVERERGEDPDPGTSRFAEWRQGIAFVRGDRRLVGVLTVAFVILFGQGLYLVLFTVFAVRTAHLPDAEAGLLRSVIGIGALVGGVLLTAFGGRFRPRALAVGGLIGTGVAMLLAWNGPRFHAPLAYYVIVFCCAGLPNVVAYVGMATIFENATPGEMRGRVFAVLGAISSTATLFGMFVAGIAIDHLPAGPVLNAQGLSFIAGAAVAWWLLRSPAPAAALNVAVTAE
jgi:MFS family permease